MCVILLCSMNLSSVKNSQTIAFIHFLPRQLSPRAIPKVPVGKVIYRVIGMVGDRPGGNWANLPGELSEGSRWGLSRNCAGEGSCPFRMRDGLTYEQGYALNEIIPVTFQHSLYSTSSNGCFPIVAPSTSLDFLTTYA